MTAPGFTFMMSSTFCRPRGGRDDDIHVGDVLVGVGTHVDRRPRVLPLDVSFQRQQLAGSMETSHSSSAAIANSRAHTEPMAPVAPTTIALP